MGGAWGVSNQTLFLHNGSTLYDLWTLIDSPPAGTTANSLYRQRVDINESREICGTIDINYGGVVRKTPFVLTPTQQ